MSLKDLNSFLDFQHIFQITDDNRTEVMREIIKLGLNYGLHVSWDKLNISTCEDTQTFTLERKTKTPLPPPNTPALTEEMISEDNTNNNNTTNSSPLTIPASTPEPVLPLDNSQTQNPHESETTKACTPALLHESATKLINTQNTIEMEIDDLLTRPEPHSSNTINPTSWADETEATLSATADDQSTIDIRNINVEDEQAKILNYCDEIIKCARTPESILNLFIKIRDDPKGPPRSSLKAIFSKISYRDRDFFRTFAKNDLIKGQHQQEYEKIENEFKTNYLKANNIGFITRSTKKKIRVIINKALFAAYLRSTDLTKMKYWQVAQLLEYGFNFFFDPSLPKVDYQELYKKCEELIKMKLPNLPNSPDEVPASIKIKLPKAIPITSPKYTKEVVDCLRAYYNFDLLPPSFFIQRPNLPENPADLKAEVQGIFPLKNRSDLRNLRELVGKLRDHYYVPNKLPESYFNLPPPKLPLPPSYTDLPEYIAQYFPVDNNPERILSGVQILRDENYAVWKLPQDFIKAKRPLPPAHWFSENNGNILPIIDQDKVKEFINQLRGKFFFKLPLGPDWIKEGLIQSEKPNMPDKFSQIEEELGITSDNLHREHPDFKVTIKKIKDNYLGEIPREWIYPQLPDLPNLTSAQEALKSENIELSLPIIEDGTLTNKIKLLRKLFHFEKLPEEFITELESPDPDLTLLPKLF
jgi:hypothetical protein